MILKEGRRERKRREGKGRKLEGGKEKEEKRNRRKDGGERERQKLRKESDSWLIWMMVIAVETVAINR